MTEQAQSSFEKPDLSEEKIVLAALRGEPVERPPFWFMRQAGRYLPEYRKLRESVGGFLELCLSPELACEVTLQPVRRFDIDAAILFADILIIPYALGQDVRFVDGEGPVLAAVRAGKDLENLRSCEEAAAYWAPVAETVRQVKAALGAEKTLIGFAGAPWTVATYMVEGGASRDFARIKSWGYRDVAGFSTLIDIINENTIAYLKIQAAAGADVLQLFDTWAGVLSPVERARWVVEPTRRIVMAVKEDFPHVPIIGFPRGIGFGLPDYGRRTGVDAIGLDTGVDPAAARRAVADNIALQGNLDPHLLATGGEELKRAAETIVSALGPSRFVFNLGHGILPQTPPEHVAELVSCLKSWRYA